MTPDSTTATRYVYDFEEGDRDKKDLLGGKGANLSEMTNLGLPVPPGFTVTTEACRIYMETGYFPEGLMDEVAEHVAKLEEKMGKKLGDPSNPLLVSVRSGAKFSMPGMMDTVLNLGMNDESLKGLIAQSGNERFAYDAYRRFIQMFGKIVMDVPGEAFEHEIERLKEETGVTEDTDLGAEDLKELTARFKQVVQDKTGKGFPDTPMEQLKLAIEAVFQSWSGERAKIYRRQNRIPDSLGTGVNIQTIVFGNLGEDSGTGVAFTRDAGSGAKSYLAEYLPNAQGEDVVSGARTPLHLDALKDSDRASYDKLTGIMAQLEDHYRDMCDIEFTVEKGKLWMLQTRIGKRTAGAAVKIAVDLVSEGKISEKEAVLRVDPSSLDQLLHPQFDTSADIVIVAKGLNASPGAAVGKAVFDAHTAVAMAEAGEKVILVRPMTEPEDVGGMYAAQGILTSRGGKTSHAAVVARGAGKPCVCGAESLKIDVDKREFTVGEHRVVEGDIVAINGNTGEIALGEVPLVEPELSADLSDPGMGRRHPPPQGAGQRRHPRGRRQGPGVRRRGHRTGADRAHVPGRPSAGSPPDDPGEHARRGAGGPGRAAGASAGGLHRHLHRHERPAGDHPSAGPAAARVPAVVQGAGAADPGPGNLPFGGEQRVEALPLGEHRRPARLSVHGAVGGEGDRRAQDPSGKRSAVGGVQPHARHAGGAAGHREAGSVRHAGAGDHRGCGSGQGGRQRAGDRDHDPAGRGP